MAIGKKSHCEDHPKATDYGDLSACNETMTLILVGLDGFHFLFEGFKIHSSSYAADSPFQSTTMSFMMGRHFCAPGSGGIFFLRGGGVETSLSITLACVSK
jgi:hypothetical protein